MNRLILRYLINAAAIYVALGTNLLKGIHAENTGWVGILGLALVFTAVNTLLRPLLKFVTCPFIILTLGLFTLLINAALFVLTGWIGQLFGIGFTVDSFWWAVAGGLVSGVVSLVLTLLFRDELKREERR
jgi:putative membrane protein